MLGADGVSTQVVVYYKQDDKRPVTGCRVPFSSCGLFLHAADRIWNQLGSTVDTNVKRRRTMKTMPLKCKDVNAVGAFCDCIADTDSVDVAAKAFCKRAVPGNGEDLAELKKALMDLEKPGD